MDSTAMQGILKEIATTNVTKTVHTKAYESISPTRPELSQTGKVILITGGGTGVGLSIAQSFVHASADTIIILGRRQAVLEAATSQLEALTKTTGTSTKILSHTCDLVKQSDVEAFWKALAAQNIVVDVLVHSAAKFTEPKPLLELGADEVWSQIEANAKAPLYFTEKFCKQENDKLDKQKFIINLTSAVIHSSSHPAVAQRPSYILSKTAGALYFQLLAQETPREKIQIVTIHPGLVYNEEWKAMGFAEEWFEDADLSGGFALWLASPHAAFLHGRTVWATWDVNELADAAGAVRKRIDQDHYFLRVSVVGLDEGMLA